MERIGIAASKMAKGNLLLYNFFVILISFLFSFFILIVAGTTVFFSLVVISYVGGQILGQDFSRNWWSVVTICMVSLSIIMGLFNLLAISRNIKFSKHKN